MDFFDTPYFKLNKLLLSSVGLWPFQTYSVKILTLSFAIVVMTIFVVPQIMYVLIHGNDLEKLFEVLPILTGTLICFMKIITLNHNSEKFKEILQQMYDDWINKLQSHETQILARYAELTRKFTLALLISISGFAFCYSLLPLAGPVLDIISPLNETRPTRFPHPAEYFVDQEKYYCVILLNMYVGYFIAILISVSADTVYVFLIGHICGMYNVLCHRLGNLTACDSKLQWTENNYACRHYEIYRRIRYCIQLHERIRIFIEKTESTFALFLIFDIGLGFVLQTASCIMIVVQLEQSSEIVRYIAVALLQGTRFFFNSLAGQQITDHSAKISTAAYNGLWYDIPVEMQKLLILLMVRSQKTSQITIAKLYVINLQGFTTVMRTSISYCTVMISLRGT